MNRLRAGLLLIALLSICHLAAAEDDVPKKKPAGRVGAGNEIRTALDELAELGEAQGWGQEDELAEELSKAGEILDKWKKAPPPDEAAATPTKKQAEKRVARLAKPLHAVVAPQVERAILEADTPGLEVLAQHLMQELVNEQEPARQQFARRIAELLLREKVTREGKAAAEAGFHPPSRREIKDVVDPEEVWRRLRSLGALPEEETIPLRLSGDGTDEHRRATALRAFERVGTKQTLKGARRGRALPTLPWRMKRGGGTEVRDSAWPRSEARDAPSGGPRTSSPRRGFSAPPPSPVPVRNEGGVRIEFPAASIQAAMRKSVAVEDLERRLLGIRSPADAGKTVSSIVQEAGRELLRDVTETPLTEATVLSLQRLVRAAAPYAGRWADLPQDLRHPGRLGRIHGYLIDGDDVLLIGRPAEQAAKPLDIDHIIVAFRALWRDGVIPRVSLDGNPFDPGGPQLVRVEGIARDSDFARVLLDADYKMKRVFFGDLIVDVPDWLHLGTRLLRLDTETFEHMPSRARYWMTPAELTAGSIRRSKDETLVLFDLGARVLTEAMDVSAGKLIGTGRSRSVDEDMVNFATRHFGAFERAIPDWRRLRACFDLSLAARLLRDRLPKSVVLSSVSDLPVQSVDVPESYPGVTAATKGEALTTITVQGGVSIDPSVEADVFSHIDAPRGIARLRPAGTAPASVVAGLSLPLARGSAVQPTGDTPKLRASRFLRGGDPEAAVAVATASIREAPDDLGRRLVRVSLFLEGGLYGLATRDLYTLQSAAEDPRVRLLSYRVRIENGEPLSDVPAQIRGSLAYLYHRLAANAIGRTPAERAVRLADHALRLEDTAASRWLRARARVATNDIAGAHADIEAGLVSSRQPDLLLLARAHLHLKQNAYAAVIADADAALAVDADHPEAHVLKAMAWMESDPSPTGLARASEAVDRALDMAPEYVRAHLAQASILQAQGYKDAARLAADKVIALAPGSPHGYILRALLLAPMNLRRQHPFDAQAFADCTVALRIDPRDVTARALRAAQFVSIWAATPAETGKLLDDQKSSGLLLRTADREYGRESHFLPLLQAAVEAGNSDRIRSLFSAACGEAGFFDMARACRDAEALGVPPPFTNLEAWRTALDRTKEALK